MSELQKASWGWLGEHVQASAPQCPRLQLPRSTTSPSQGVIAAAGTTARLSKVAVLQPELVHPTVRGNFDPGRAALREPKGTGWGAARLPRRWRTTLRVKEREPEEQEEREELEEKSSESPPAGRSAPLPGGRVI